MPSKRATPSKPRQRMIAAHLSEESHEALVAFTEWQLGYCAADSLSGIE